jgi:hypothetical protein
MAEKEQVVHAERIFITAEMARRFLTKNIDHNRAINRSRLDQDVRDMKAGKWMENGETIKFADTGELIDGQHRLMACAEAGAGFWSLVVYGVKKEAFITIDRGQPRSIGQQFNTTRGTVNYNHVSAALVWLYSFHDGIALTHQRPTAGELADVLDENPGIEDSVKAARSIHHQIKVPSVSALAFCHYCMTRQDAGRAEKFFDAMATGANLREIDPAYCLRQRLIKSAGSAMHRIPTYDFIALVFKAWNAEKEGRTIENGLRWSVGESFPNIGPIGTRKRRLAPVSVPVKTLGTARKPFGKGNAKSPHNPVAYKLKKLSGKWSLDKQARKEA